jgi:putative redox protein
VAREEGEPIETVSASRLQGYSHSLRARGHTLTADEPNSRGGSDAGPMPEELLALSLASCTAITIEMYADRKGWELGEVEVTVDYGAHEGGRPRYDVLVTVPEELSDEQRERLRAIAGKCPIHTILLGEATITDQVETRSV